MDFMAFLEQMGANEFAPIAAFFIGLMTAISPCPLITNITAIVYVSRKIEHSRHTLLVGTLYALGRAFAYTTLAGLIVYVGINVQAVSFFLQEHGEGLLGPILILVGLVMLELIRPEFLMGETGIASLQDKVADQGYLGAFLLGALFALAFCPFSAVLFFGMLVPLALATGDAIVLPAIFGFATGLPVILGAILLVTGISRLSRVVGEVQKIEKYIRLAAGAVFVMAGLYYLLTRTIGIF